ncbi:MAG: hypothetical protein QG594_770 [Bacteroidota bacterium]|nr:hypothetical protein [Bacteroidota bacterium]
MIVICNLINIKKTLLVLILLTKIIVKQNLSTYNFITILLTIQLIVKILQLCHSFVFFLYLYLHFKIVLTDFY